MIKKILSILIVMLGFVGVSYGTFAVRQLGTYGYNPGVTSQDIQVTTRGILLTQLGGVTKKVMFFDGDSYIFWGSNNLMYGVYNFNNQGTLKYYYVCPELLGNETSVVNISSCDLYNVVDGSSQNTIGSFLNSLVSTDYYSISSITNNGWYYTFCISSHLQGRSICWYFASNNLSDEFISGTSVSMPYQGFDNINSNTLYDPPSFSGGGGSSTGGNNNIVIRTGKNYYCPTYGELMKNYGINYNTGLCYNGTMRYLNGSITTVQQQDIFTVFNNDFNNFKQRIKVYNNNCITPATQTQCENAFNGEREKYSIIANAIQNNVDDIGLWNYCNIAQQDPNISTCVANPGEIHKENPTPEELINYIGNIGNIGEIYTPTSGNILNKLIGTGETREDIATRDLFGQIDQIKDKISSIFEERNGVNGIIPDYILWLILTTLLLTVLLKK